MLSIKQVVCCSALSVLLSVPAALGQNTTPQNNTGMAGTAANSSNSSAVTPADKKFMKAAAQGGATEVELGQLALKKSSNDQVRKFAQRMVTDHSKANEQLQQIAASKGVDLPQQPDAKQKATKSMLSKLSGEQFDKAYMKDMVSDHKADIADFQKESNSGGDPEVKNFASETLPTLQDHLREAEQVRSGQTQQSSLR